MSGPEPPVPPTVPFGPCRFRSMRKCGANAPSTSSYGPPGPPSLELETTWMMCVFWPKRSVAPADTFFLTASRRCHRPSSKQAPPPQDGRHSRVVPLLLPSSIQPGDERRSGIRSSVAQRGPFHPGSHRHAPFQQTPFPMHAKAPSSQSGGGGGDGGARGGASGEGCGGGLRWRRRVA